MTKFEEFAKLNKVIPLTLKTVKISANIQSDLRKRGLQIGHTDTLIAGVAMASELQLVTNNIAHFERIEGLAIDNWSK